MVSFLFGEARKTQAGCFRNAEALGTPTGALRERSENSTRAEASPGPRWGDVRDIEL
jgi:hypothetical protein